MKAICVFLLFAIVIVTVFAEEVPAQKEKVDRGEQEAKNTPTYVEDIDFEAYTEEYIKSKRVVVFSKSFCPYCKRAKDLLFKERTGMDVIELDQAPGGAAIHEYLKKKTNQRTVPNIFISGEHIGGFDSLSKLVSENPTYFRELLDKFQAPDLEANKYIKK